MNMGAVLCTCRLMIVAFVLFGGSAQLAEKLGIKNKHNVHKCVFGERLLGGTPISDAYWTMACVLISVMLLYVLSSSEWNALPRRILQHQSFCFCVNIGRGVPKCWVLSFATSYHVSRNNHARVYWYFTVKPTFGSIETIKR